MTRSTDFSLAGLYAAIDAQRQARGLTWAQAMREINGDYRPPTRPVATSTVTTLQTKAVAEGDGVLGMLRWLGRAPESFIAGLTFDPTSAALPDVPANKVLRLDTRRLHAALDDARQARGMTWQQVAVAIGGVSAASLTHLKKGGRTGFPGVTRMTQWLGRPVADFTRFADW